MKIDRFNESVENKKTYYRLYVYAENIPNQAIKRRAHDTAKEAIDELKSIVYNGLPGYRDTYITDAYIEKITRVKTNEIETILKTKKFNL